MNFETIQGWLQLGVGGLLLAALFLGARRFWVFGWVHREIVERLEKEVETMTIDRNYWRDVALRGTNVAETVVRRAKP
jgi:hypothetical protein